MSTFTGPVKAFCPCDAGRPQDCKPEEWRPAHAPSECTTCGRPRHQHREFVRCPAPAPTEAGDPYCICGGGADHDDDCPRADEAGGE